MDRSVLESDPFRIIEGMIIGRLCYRCNTRIYLLPAEYPLAIQKLNNAIEKCRAYGLLGKNILDSDFEFDLKVKKGPELLFAVKKLALIASIEGKRVCLDQDHHSLQMRDYGKIPPSLIT